MAQADKLLNNPIRLVVVSNLHQVASADFTALIELTGATKGNLSIQLKKHAREGLHKDQEVIQRQLSKHPLQHHKKRSTCF